MGIVLWLGCAIVSFVFARVIPFARRSWLAELAVSIITAIALGILATSLDFGGWNEPDWRAGLFIVFGSFAAAGALRAIQCLLPTGGTS